MGHFAVVTIDHLDDRRAAERAGVKRLPARRWIKRRPVEPHVHAAIDDFTADDRGLKRPSVGLGVIDAGGHGFGFSMTSSTTGSSKKKMAPPLGERR